MSRIDEAMARARTAAPEELAPPTSRPTPDGGIEFPAEAEEGPAKIPAAPELSVGGPRASPVSSDAVVEAEGDLSALPAAEKLMLHNGEATSVEQYRRLAARLLMAPPNATLH